MYNSISISVIYGMDIRLLRYFVAVAEEGHVTRAAERLGIQQPPLSQQIKVLESGLQVQLFRRRPRGVTLTDAGKALFGEAKEILQRLEQAKDITRRAARGEVGQLSIGIAGTAHFCRMVPRVIRHFRNDYPLVVVKMCEGGSSELVSQVQSGNLDLAFVRKVFSAGELTVDRILDEPMVVALPSNHPLAGKLPEGRKIALKLLAKETFVTYPRPEGPGLTDVVVAACQAAGFTPRFGQEAPRPTSALNFVAAGHGICIVPLSLSRMNLEGVTYRALATSPRLSAPLNIISRRGEASEVSRAFLKAVRGAARDA
jgi:DNA-binding transcriptional LysR family regulator